MRRQLNRLAMKFSPTIECRPRLPSPQPPPPYPVLRNAPLHRILCRIGAQCSASEMLGRIDKSYSNLPRDPTFLIRRQDLCLQAHFIILLFSSTQLVLLLPNLLNLQVRGLAAPFLGNSLFDREATDSMHVQDQFSWIISPCRMERRTERYIFLALSFDA